MFQPRPNCEKCSLHDSANHVGIPTRPYQGNRYSGSHTALLIVGQSPGLTEDRKGESFIGWTGMILDKFIVATGLHDLCDIYLGNALRCLPPQSAGETQSQARACRKWLQEDIEIIKSKGYSRLVIFALGAKAVYSTMNKSSLNVAFKHQGEESSVFEGLRVFCTFHPANLHASRSPGKVKAVEAHFLMLRKFLQDGELPNTLKVKVELGVPVPGKLPQYVAVDIETYGIIKGEDQTVFHPIKSKEIDGIPFHKQVKMVSFAWEDGDQIRTAEYVFTNLSHRKTIHEWFRQMSKQGVTCLGQNIKFDLLYLAMSGDPILQYWIRGENLIVDDTLLWTFLYYEQQPEKGLKEICKLYGIADYSSMKVTGKTGNAKSANDPDAHLYNCFDSAATLTLRRKLEEMIRDRYGDDSAKLSETCARVRDMVIWDVFDLEWNGSSFAIDKIELVHAEENGRCERILGAVKKRYDLKLAGAGSDAPLREFFIACATDAGLLNDDRLEWTKTKGIGIGRENVNLLLPLLPEGRNKRIMKLYKDRQTRTKIVASYTTPLLFNPLKGIVIREGNVGMVYPSWYPIPSYSDRGGSAEEKSGGQIQGRFSCQKPGRQTEPPQIRACACSRFGGGRIIEYDVNQDHIRMAALLSGDPVLMGAYTTPGESAHTRTALTLFPQYEADRDSFKQLHKKEYALGKTINFLVLFRGGAHAFQSNAMKDVGIELDIGFCEAAIRSWYRKHHVYGEWQESLLRRASRDGYLVLPTGWSRTFGKGRDAADAQAGEICNFMHQAPCAQVLQSAHYRAQILRRKTRLRSVICMQLYDALYWDEYPGEEEAIDEIMRDAMLHPPLLKVFEDWVGRTLPWGATKKIGKEEWDL